MVELQTIICVGISLFAVIICIIALFIRINKPGPSGKPGGRGPTGPTGPDSDPNNSIQGITGPTGPAGNTGNNGSSNRFINKYQLTGETTIGVGDNSKVQINGTLYWSNVNNNITVHIDSKYTKVGDIFTIYNKNGDKDVYLDANNYENYPHDSEQKFTLNNKFPVALIIITAGSTSNKQTINVLYSISKTSNIKD